MSWLARLIVGGSKQEPEDPTVMMDDPSVPGRKVPSKPANQPFLAHKKYMDEQRRKHEEWLERKKERDEKIKRGEPVGPLERDPTAEHVVGVKDLLRFLVILVVGAMFAGKFITGSWTWDYEGKWVQMKTYWPANQRLFTEKALAQYDGTDPNKPIYLAVDGDVYDVSANRRTYGPGGSYHILAGSEGGRSFATGCFHTHRTHDLRGLDENEMRAINHWKKFFANHKDYVKIGRVSQPPIDPASPIPEHCDPEKAKKQREQAAQRKAAEQAKDSKSKDEL